MVDTPALVADLQRLPVVALALADIALDIDVRQKVHLHLDDTVAPAGLAASAFYIEAETTRRVTPGAGLVSAGKQFPDRGEEAGIGCRIGTGGAADRALIDIHHLVEVLQALDRPERRRIPVGRIQGRCGQRIEGVVDQGRFAGSGDAGDTGEQADRQLQVDLLEIVAPRPQQPQIPLPILQRGAVRDLDGESAGQVLAGQRRGHRFDLAGAALGHDMPAVYAGARTDVHHVIGAADRLFVVLHHDHGVTEVPQIGQGPEQAVVVPLVQADGGLVQHIHDAHQAGADLAGQADALGLAAGQGLGAALQCQVVESHVHQKAQALGHLLDDPAGDLAPLARQFQLLEELQGLADRQGGDGGQVVPIDEDMACGLVEPGAMTFRTGMGGDVAGQLFPYRIGLGLPVTPLHVADDAFERMSLGVAAPAFVEITDLDRLPATAVEDVLSHPLRQLLPGGLDVEAVVASEGADQREIIGIAPVPATHRPGRQAQVGMGHHPLRVEELLHAETVAGRAGAHRVVEREQAWLQLLQAVAAYRAGEIGGEHQFFLFRLVHPGDAGEAAGELQGGLEGFRETQFQVVTHLEAVDHGLDTVFAVQFQVRYLVQLMNLTVDTGADEALGVEFRQQLVVFALAGRYHRGQKHQAAAFGQAQYLVHHLAHGLGLERQVVLRTARGTGSGEQQPQIVVDLGDGADRGPGIVGRGLLFDGDGRRQSLDMVHIRLFHHRQKLARVGGEGLHVAALPLGVDGIEGQRGLAGARQPGDHDQAVPGEIQIDVFQVVGACAPDVNAVHLRTGE